jgi:predicted small lipoprotein YifL
MKIASAVAAAAALIALSACGEGSPAEQQGPAAKVAAKPKDDAPVSLKDRDPVAYRSNLGSVMAQVTPSQQNDFQTLMACTVKKAADKGEPAVVSAAMASELLHKVQTDPHALDACS